MTKRISELDSPHREQSLEPLNVLFAPLSRYHSHTFTLGRNFELLSISLNYTGYRYAITKRIPALDYPHREHSLESFNVPFEPFSGSLLHTFTLEQNF